MTKLRLYALKGECYRGNPRTRYSIVSNIKNWIWGDIEGTFDYAIEHGYLERVGEEQGPNTLWKPTKKLERYKKNIYE